MFPFTRVIVVAGMVGAVAACAQLAATKATGSPTEFGETLFDPATSFTDGWEHIPLKGETEYRIAVWRDRLAFRAIGKRSASMLARRITIDLSACPTFEWSWSVDDLQAGADLTEKFREDVAASVFVLFGDPGFLFDPKPVPTIRYVWTNERHVVDAVIENPYMPGVVMSIVVRRGAAMAGNWVTERRNLVDDFRRAFGEAVPSYIHAIALFTDNDQTGEPVEAYYGTGRALCRK